MVSYDIPGDRTRAKVSKTLCGFGRRQQYSVFECEVSEARYRELKKRIWALIDPDEDSVIFYHLCAHCKGGIEVYGQAKVLELEEVIVI